MPIGVELRLYNDTGAALANLSGIQACWWDVEELYDIDTPPIGKSNAVTTNDNGEITLDLSSVSGLTVGDYGYLVLYKLDALDHRDSLIFAGKVQTSEVSSGVDMYYYDSGWTRPAGWLTFTPPSELEEKFIGLHAVYEENANFVALSAAGNYTVNWGDGTGDQNIDSGVTAQTNLLWENAPPESDVGIADAVACTFTDSDNTVGLTGHNFKNGEKVAFSAINSTTGISTYTTYWVINATSNTFQIAATQGGTAVFLTTDGTGMVYRPKFRQVLVVVVPQNGQHLTALNLHVKHSQSGLQQYTSGFIDIAISGQYLTDLRIGVQTPGASTQVINFGALEAFNLVRSNLKQCGYLLYFCHSLQKITDIATSTDAAFSAPVTFQDTGDTVTHPAHGRQNGECVIFTSITGTTGITVGQRYFIVNATTNTYQVASTYGGTAQALTTNGSGTAVYGTDFSDMLNGCRSLRSIPLLNTAAGVMFSGMFANCYSLRSLPLLNTAAGTSFSHMFNGCYSLQSVPLLNTAAGVVFNGMFANCYSLRSLPLLNTAAGTNFSYMFNGCYSLQSVPLLNVAAGTNFSSMFNGCSSLQSVPLLNVAAGTNFSFMFSGCSSLRSVPLLNVAAGTNFSSMFSGCSSLQVGALSGTRFSISYANCKLSGAELNRIYSNLGAPSGGAQTITVTNNWGTIADNPDLVPSGWTVVGS